jgi:phospholipid/cholesterol/gamma-HCH transport system substrate-binding protein
VPSQKQLMWSQLKVGIVVIAASVTLGILILLMSGTGGFFTKKIILYSYFDNAGGLTVGAPVRLQGVDIGNVTGIRVVADPSRKLTPVQVTMKVVTKYQASLRKDSVTMLATAGVLGETYIDINSALAHGPEAANGDILATQDTPQIQDVVRASQSTLQNLDALEKRVDRILAFVESGQGSLGSLIYDPKLYDRLNTTLGEFQTLANDVSNGKGSLGKLLTTDELYNNANSTITKLNAIIDDLNAGKGSAGKLLKDPALFDNANKAIASVNQITDKVNSGKGTVGMLMNDQEFADKVRNTANKLSDIASRLDAGEGTAGKFLNDPSLYDNSSKTLVEAQQLIQAVRQDPKKYLVIRLKIF